MLKLGSAALGRRLVIAIPYLWLLALFLVPFAIVIKISLSDVVMARPPYTPAFDWAGGDRRHPRRPVGTGPGELPLDP